MRMAHGVICAWHTAWHVHGTRCDVHGTRCDMCMAHGVYRCSGAASGQ